MTLKFSHYILFATLLAGLGVALVIGAWQINSSGNSKSSALPPGIEELIPMEGAQVLRQSTVGVQLSGNQQYDIQLWLNGQALPLDEAQISNTRFTYQPSDGYVVEELDVGENCIRAEYSLRTRPDDATVFNWCFRAT